MDPRLRTALVALAAVGLAAWVGVAIAQEQRFLAWMVTLGSVWVLVSWTGGPLAEAWLLGFLVFGYTVGNRGFAQIMPLGGLPLFFGELALAFAVPMALLRGALRRELPLQRDALNLALVLFMALGAGRIVWDVRIFGILALRDFAMIYYISFFFLAQTLARHGPSRALFDAVLAATFVVLVVAGLLSSAFTEFFTRNLLVDGVPLVLFKGDLLATFLNAGFLVLLPVTGVLDRANWWRWLFAIASLVFSLTLLSRASMVGLLVGLGWLALGGRWRHAAVLVAVSCAGLLAIFGYSALQRKEFTQTRAYAIVEAARSVVDFSGTQNYESGQTNDKSDNNRFRLVWWRNVIEETAERGPVFGLGFGADLARGFVQEYYPDSTEAFVTRSPHNIFITTFGRMGAIGALGLLLVYLTQLQSTRTVARATLADPRQAPTLVLQAACWVVLVSSCFGVVLEGPMGAIPFWIMLGLAHHDATRATERAPAPAPAVTAATPAAVPD